MMCSTIMERVERVNDILQQIDILNDRARILIHLIEKGDRKEKDLIRYGGLLGS
jgi:hypothetical protein